MQDYDGCLTRMESGEYGHFGTQLDEDTELMKRAADGDALAFDRLYRKYLLAVTTYLISHNEHNNSLEDLVQEVFCRLWQSRGRFQGASTVRSYLYGIVRNVLSEEVKRLSKRVSTVEGEFPKGFSDCPVDLSDPASRLSRTEVQEVVWEATSGLPAKERQAVGLFYFGPTASLKNMAKRAGCSTEAFRSRLRRARQHLSQILSNLEP